MYVGVIATFLVRRYGGLPDDTCNGLRLSLNNRNLQLNETVYSIKQSNFFDRDQRQLIKNRENAMGAGGFGQSHSHRYCTLIAVVIPTSDRIIIIRAGPVVCVSKAERVRVLKNQGLTIGEIANAMTVSKRTVFRYLSQKL